MSCSKPLPPFTYDLLYYLNRDQLERFSIICRPLKKFIDRYFPSKPYRVFDRLFLRKGMFTLPHNIQSKEVQWHPAKTITTCKNFLKCNIDSSFRGYTCYSFAAMMPYLAPIVRIKKTYISGDSTYNPEHIEQMESFSYLWRDGDVNIGRGKCSDFQLILNSPTLLQCRELYMYNAHFAYKIFYSLNFIEIFYYAEEEEINTKSWLQFFEQPGDKPVVVFRYFNNLLSSFINNLLDHLSKEFSSAVSPNAFRIVFIQRNKSLTEFRETNKNSGEILEFKKGLPAKYQTKCLEGYDNYTLERSSI